MQIYRHLHSVLMDLIQGFWWRNLVGNVMMWSSTSPTNTSPLVFLQGPWEASKFSQPVLRVNIVLQKLMIQRHSTYSPIWTHPEIFRLTNILSQTPTVISSQKNEIHLDLHPQKNYHPWPASRLKKKPPASWWKAWNHMDSKHPKNIPNSIRSSWWNSPTALFLWNELRLKTTPKRLLLFGKNIQRNGWPDSQWPTWMTSLIFQDFHVTSVTFLGDSVSLSQSYWQECVSIMSW